MAEAGRTVSRAPIRYLRVFWERAYRENITGMAAMVAYNLALALFPFALLVLFVFGQVIQNPDVEASVLRDLQSIFPAAEQSSLASIVDRIRDSSTTIGVVAAIGAIWIGASFWGAMDTAFCRIYHVECRGWVEQKRFALVMLVVVDRLPRRERRDPGRRGRARLERRGPPVRPRRDRRPAERGASSSPRSRSPSRSSR